MWAIIGLLLALGGAALASARSRSARHGYYESQVYGMTATSHRRFAIVSLVFAGFFALLGAFPIFPISLVFGAYVVFIVLYLSSFARGATGEDE